jgi:Uma2 family endonuclease
MPGDAAHALRMTYAQYLELERSTDLRHEYLDGEVWAMAGGTTAHSLVKSNLLRAVGNALEGKPCLALDSDQKIDVAETGLVTYPDLSVTCGGLQKSARDANAIVNPTLVVEVLSPSTEARDLGFKTRHYKRLASLRQIVFVWPEERAIQVLTRADAGAWIVRDLEEHEPIVLASIDVTVTRAQVFARLEDVEG